MSACYRMAWYPGTVPARIDLLVILEIIKILEEIRKYSSFLRTLNITPKFSVKAIIDDVKLTLDIIKTSILRSA